MYVHKCEYECVYVLFCFLYFFPPSSPECFFHLQVADYFFFVCSFSTLVSYLVVEFIGKDIVCLVDNLNAHFLFIYVVFVFFLEIIFNPSF